MSTSLDEDLIVLNHMEFDLQCDWGAGSCHHPAEWIARVSCCGRALLWCNTHKEFMLEMQKTHILYDNDPPRGCGTVDVKIISIERIKK